MEETDNEKMEKLEEQIKKQKVEKNRLNARRGALAHQLTAGGMQQPALPINLQLQLLTDSILQGLQASY